MDLIDHFVHRYRREFDFYEQAARIAAQQLDGRLQASGIRAMVTSRAKNPRRLEEKVRQRHTSSNFSSHDQIYAEIVDLAGVRVALYFPGERNEVDKIIKDQFAIVSAPKEFKGTSNPSYGKRFTGYWAIHYRAHLRDISLPEADSRYVDAQVEIQVASVLMHAWAEVEHDLVYKPLQGNLSEDEHAILDELNGMVLVGEIALERLQRAAEARVNTRGSRFENHYDLASFLLEAAKPMLQDGADPALGDIELLFRLLVRIELVTPDTLRPYLSTLHPDTERRPVAQQIVDQILAADPDRYGAYATVRAEMGKDFKQHATFADFTDHSQAHLERSYTAIGYFLAQWIEFERFLRELAHARGEDPPRAAIPSAAVLRRLEIFDERVVEEFERIRRLRNHLVHGVGLADEEVLRETGSSLKRIMQDLLGDKRPEVRRAAELAIGLERD